MTPEEIEGNKIIAEFCGNKYSDESFWIPEDICNNPPPYDSEAILFKTDELKFHSSWDWQIPAWSKITHELQNFVSLKESSDDDRKRYLKLLDKYESAIFLNSPSNGFDALVFAIKWYNQTNQPQP